MIYTIITNLINNEITYFIFYILFSLLTSYFLGGKRQIGFKLSLLFCLTLGPLIGFIITMTSSRDVMKSPEPSKIKRIVGWTILAIAFLNITDSIEAYKYNYKIITIIGLLSLSGYLIKTGKGERIENLFSMVISNKKSMPIDTK